jgi:hypothetical protein
MPAVWEAAQADITPHTGGGQSNTAFIHPNQGSIQIEGLEVCHAHRLRQGSVNETGVLWSLAK